MKKFLVAMGLVAFAVVGCDDSSSASAGSNGEPSVESSSSSVTPQSNSSETSVSSSSSAKSSSSKDEKETKVSSSSVMSSSFSSVILSSNDESSSSSAKSSSSNAMFSSSSVEEPPTSSETESSSSSSEDKINCSALLEGESGWSWNVPKECRFNPDVEYGSMTDTRDGQVYRTVKIGDQVWMAENLNYYDESNLSVKTKSWCYGKSDNKDSSTCDVAGRLYTWAAAIDSAKLYTNLSIDCGYDKTCALPDMVYGICPPGWHMPNNTEWNALFSAVGGVSTAGKVLKSRSGWNVSGDGSDALGFSALPAGYKGDFSDLDLDGYAAYFWSSSEDNSRAYYMKLRYSRDKVYLNSDHKYLGFSVRCIKD